MPPAPQQQQGSTDNAMAPVWITILLFAVAIVLWLVGHQYIIAFVFKLNILQAALVNFFLRNDNLAHQIYLMQTVNPMSLNWPDFVALLHNVGEYICYPIGVVLIILAILLYRSNITLKFRKIYNMKSLRAQEQYNWTAIMPVVKEDLTNTPVDEGPWAMALSPVDFARKYRLLRKEDPLLDEAFMGYEGSASIKRGDTKQIFTLQLGPYWEGFGKCQPHVQALAAVFMARMNRDRESAKFILDSLNQSFVDGKLNFAVAVPTLQKYYNSENVQEILARHAYVLTVMASLLAKSREDGVVPSAEFLWLKPVDRRLWYMLNCVGRQTPFAEVAGPFAHWIAEKKLGRKTMVPMIEEAIKALELAIKEVKLPLRELKELEKQ